MKLYIVDFSFWDNDEVCDIQDRWLLACEDSSALEKIMEENFKELERHGYKPISYSFSEFNKTDNGYKILIG